MVSVTSCLVSFFSLQGLTADVNPATVREGERVTLTCVTTCTLSDHPTIVWFRDGHSVSNSEFLASIQDAGSYQCAVRGQDHLSSDSVFLDIQYAPNNVTLSVSPSGDVVKGSSVTLTYNCSANPPVLTYNLYRENAQPLDTSVSVSPSGPVGEGRFLNLTCSSHANPAVSYTWYLVNGSSPIQSGTYLILEEVSPANSGRYYWEARNKDGALNSSFMVLSVLYAPRNTLVSVSPSGPVVEGSSVNLTCSSHANPGVENYTWFKKDGTDTSQTGSGEVLKLTSLTSSDSGQYFCEARNKEGAHNSTVLSLILQETNTVQIAIYISSAAAVFMVIILLVFLWMW
ncbi:B-cell receptor CD22-like [Salvelinus alpinus]